MKPELPFLRCRGLLCLSLFLVLGAGCSLVRTATELPGDAVRAVIPGTTASQPDPAALQTEIQRFADEYASRTTAALDDYAARTGTPEGRRQALEWKVSAGFAAVSIASGPNPQANLLDFLALATITHTVLEEVWIKSTNGPAFQSWLSVSRGLETNAWKLASGVLGPEQQLELRGAIRRWWEENPGARTGFFARPQEFSSLIRQSQEKSGGPESVFSLVGLDPTAGLDPAVREVTRTRLFAERAMFMVQRMPFLVRWQAELLADDLSRNKQFAAAITSADRLSRAAESASQTAAQLPDRITSERKAILESLEAQEGRLRELSAEVGRTLSAGEQMSTSMNTTIMTFDALMKRFGVGETNRATPSKTNAEPFRIQDYGQTAVNLEAMARQLTELLKTLDQTLGSTNLAQLSSQVSPVVRQAQTGGKEVVDYAFRKGVLLVVIVLVAALIYRFLANRMSATGSRLHS